MNWTHGFWILLLDTAWKSTALLAAGLGLARLLGNGSAALRHLIWASALAGLLVLPAVRMAAPSLAIAPVIVVPASVRSGIQQVAVRSVNGDALLALAWMAGALLVLLRLVLAIVRSHRIAGSGTSLDAKWPALPGTAAEISHSQAISVPVALGVFRSRIIVPSVAIEWPRERLRLVVAHEMAHVARRDCWINILIETVCSVYWFHPLVWLAARRCREEAEKACDDRVLADGADAADYAGHLLSTARAIKSLRVPSVAAAVVSSPSVLEKRLISILDERRSRAPVMRRTMLAAAAVAPLCILLLSSLEPAIAQTPQPSRTYHVGEQGTTSPKLLYKVEPQYTEEARDAHVEGSVLFPSKSTRMELLRISR